MPLTYVALVQKAETPDADYGVMFPDFPGAVFGGKNLQKALENAREGLIFHMEGLLDSGEMLPKPQSIDHIMAAVLRQGEIDVVPCLVHVAPPGGHLKRVNISLDSALLAEIDHAAKIARQSRSQFLAIAARSWLA